MKQKKVVRPIIIHTHLLQKFMSHEKDYANLLALYSFYIYHAQTQKTNQVFATDEFTRRGMNWAIDRVKRVKKILKEMKVIEVIQKDKYYYIRLFFIYTKKKIDEIFAKEETDAPKVTEQKENSTPSKSALESEKSVVESPKERVKFVFETMLVQSRIDQKRIDRTRKAISQIEGIAKYQFSQVALARWVAYLEQREIGYNKGNLKHWIEKLNGRTTIEQIEAVHKAREKRWKDIYLSSIEDSEYHRFLGKSLMMDKECDTLLDIDKQGGRFVYQFKNAKLQIDEPPSELFKRCGYEKSEVKTAPIAQSVKDKIMGCINRM